MTYQSGCSATNQAVVVSNENAKAKALQSGDVTAVKLSKTSGLCHDTERSGGGVTCPADLYI
jgi:hypothetical protein